ncbi:MAG: crossover junction endodeoxyribonuclease RuvC [Bacteroidota bacterium]
MIVLGVDPGTRHTGLGTVEVVGSRERALEARTVSMPSDMDHALRIQRIYEGVLEAIDAHHPDELAVELPFMGKNAQSMLKLGRAQAAVMLAAMHREVPVAQYAPAEVKKALVGNGRASKTQVGFMVRTRLGLKETPQEDAADALAVALCHAARRPGVPASGAAPGGSASRPRPTGATKSWADFIAQNPDRIR